MRMNPNIILAGNDPLDTQGKIERNALADARGQFAQKRNALADLELQAGSSELQRAEEAQLIRMVTSAADPASAYPEVKEIARARGMDVDWLPEQYDPNLFAALEGAIATDAGQELTEFERIIGGLSQQEQSRAKRVRAGLEPDANALMRGTVGDKAPNGFRFGGDGNLQFIPGGPADPQYKADARGNGTTIFHPETGDPLVQMGGNPVGRRTQNEIETRELDVRDELSRLERIQQNFLNNPDLIDMQTMMGNLKAWGLEWQDFIGGPDSLTDEQRKHLEDVTYARADVLENLNFTIKQITGAAMTEAEAVRIGGTLPIASDSPTVFMSKLNRSMDRVRASIARYNMWRNQGLGGKPEDAMPISEAQRMMDDRLKGLRKSVKAGDLTEAEAERAFFEEFGV